ncbi:hypothetical protein BSLG_005489 [Batrachochytrium salamandrivorans]|nr:hypothetical protein BASA62_007652 [Batrachochytrium salamandrivorans]KAJ1339955.1 hypothetical protein BSLG_005489 [Batrachochytrium salamandrivorans]
MRVQQLTHTVSLALRNHLPLHLRTLTNTIPIAPSTTRIHSTIHRVSLSPLMTATSTQEHVASVPVRFLTDTDTPISRMQVKPHFDALTDTEKKYAHFIGQASWAGAGIVAASMSPYAPAIVTLFLDLFTVPETRRSSSPKMVDMATLQAKSGASEVSWKHFLEYASQVLSNLANYKSFGDTKFIPRLPLVEFEAIVSRIGSDAAQKSFESLKNVIYDVLPEAQLLLGYPAEGHVSGYYSQNMSKADAEFVQKYLETKSTLFAINTRVFKTGDVFEVRVASAETNRESETVEIDGKMIKIVYGDFSHELTACANAMESALQYAANDNQKKMIQAYVDSFRSGSMDAHCESQKHWIRDIGPVVETNIGFIETYRDPAGVRAEWEGFVAIVNKNMTLKFGKLVDGAPGFISLLPWGADFEKDKFNKPDFTSLEVLSFATSGSPPAGINIPNYDDVRQTIGFKNVSLGNIVGAKGPEHEKVTFIRQEKSALYKKHQTEAFEIQVGLHELLGHGSGKLLLEEESGKFNFDINNPPLSPITNSPITTWYKPGETWGSVFKAVASSYEECRAEAVAMYLCVNDSVLDIFGVLDKQDREDIVYICYLNMARAGLLSLEFFDPSSGKWGQAHMQARFAILQVLIESGCVTITHLSDTADLVIDLDGSKIKSLGVAAVGTFLQKLNVYKATADAAAGLAFYNAATSVPESWLPWRDIVLARKLPRKILLQGNTVLGADGDVVLKEYELSLNGLIESFIERAMPNV